MAPSCWNSLFPELKSFQRTERLSELLARMLMVQIGITSFFNAYALDCFQTEAVYESQTHGSVA